MNKLIIPDELEWKINEDKVEVILDTIEQIYE